MTGLKTIYADSQGLHALAKGDPRNEYVLRWGRGGLSEDNPLPFLHHKPAGKYFLKVADDGLIVAAATLYPYGKGADDCRTDAEGLNLSQVSVHKNYKRRGFAKDLLNSVFALAAKTNSVLRIESFRPEGKKYLAPVIPDIHHNYPAIRVLYGGESVPVTGERKYSIGIEWNGPKIRFI